MAQKSYSGKLKDPRWQRLRLEILQRDNFKCRGCEDDKNTLHIHHIKYFGDPWNAPQEFLITLCEVCHQEAEYYKPTVDQFRTFKVLKFDAEWGRVVFVSFDKMVGIVSYDKNGIYEYGITFGSEKTCNKIAKFFNKSLNG